MVHERQATEETDELSGSNLNLSASDVVEVLCREDANEIKVEELGTSPSQVSGTMSTASSAATKRPIDSAIRQQRLPAWQPILTPNNVIPALFVMALLFIPLGIMFMLFSEQVPLRSLNSPWFDSMQVQEYSFDYTDCLKYAPLNEFGQAPSSLGNVEFEWRRFTKPPEGMAEELADSKPETLCELRFKVTKVINGPIFQYYRLHNYYQNQRLYVRSVDWAQLRGDKLSHPELSDCAPLVAPNDVGGPVYYPCGLIANSMFNDTIGPMVPATTGDARVYPFPAKDITWSSDGKKYGPTKYSLKEILPPPFWQTNRRLVNEDGTYKAIPNLHKDERFQNWMKVAGLPTFRKVYGKHPGDIPAGTYTVLISSTYEVSSYGAEKALIISNTSWVGGKNPFLGFAYMIAGGVFLILALAFLARHLMAPRRLGDVSYLSWNQNRLRRRN